MQMTFVILLLFFGAGLKTAECSNFKYESQISLVKGDIPNFCAKTLKGKAIAIVERKIQPPDEPKTTTDADTEDSVAVLDLIKCFIGNYLFLFILAILKWLEEVIKIKKEFVKNRFSHFVDLSDLDHVNIKLYEDKFIFISGIVHFERFANDDIFTIDFDKKGYMKLERKVEVFDDSRKVWVPLNRESESSLSSMFTFIQEKTFNGKGFLRGIEISDNQMRHLQFSERILLSNLNHETLIQRVKDNLNHRFEVENVGENYKDLNVE